MNLRMLHLYLLINAHPPLPLPHFMYLQLQESVGEQLTKNNLVVAFAALLKDPEAEVRAAASNRLRG